MLRAAEKRQIMNRRMKKSPILFPSYTVFYKIFFYFNATSEAFPVIVSSPGTRTFLHGFESESNFRAKVKKPTAAVP